VPQNTSDELYAPVWPVVTGQHSHVRSRCGTVRKSFAKKACESWLVFAPGSHIIRKILRQDFAHGSHTVRIRFANRLFLRTTCEPAAKGVVVIVVLLINLQSATSGSGVVIITAGRSNEVHYLVRFEEAARAVHVELVQVRPD
jgi:hypothetical protein